jgi:CBS domain-containing protein/uncharacterized protein (DUF2267 family)
MALDAYRRPRMIVLNAASTAYDAARAMVDNHVGAVLVSRRGGLVGIVTDRDIAAEVVAAARDPSTTTLEELGAGAVHTVDVAASLEDVVRLMLDHGCRRVPVTEGGKPIGLVTLDDLVIDGGIDRETAAEIIRRQLRAGARHKEAGPIHPEAAARSDAAPHGGRSVTRHKARAESSYARLLRAVERETNIAEPERATLLMSVVVASLCRRVLPEEARHLLAELPSKLRDDIHVLDGPNRSITSASIEGEVAAMLGVPAFRAAELVEGACRVLVDNLSAGQLMALRGQLPLDLKTLVPAAVRAQGA